jgi:molybdopterin/thiamine biosynthesis adenylyltransferase
MDRLEFALTEDQFRKVLSLLFDQRPDGDNDPERGFLALVFPATGLRRRTLILGNIIEPMPGEVSWSPRRGLTMSHRYYSRAMSLAQSTSGAGLINVHSHPRPATGIVPPEPSRQDLRTDREELCFASRTLGEERPIAAGIMTPGGGISVREYTFRHPKSQEEAVLPAFGPAGASFKYVERIRVIGPGLRVLPGNPDSPSNNEPIDLSMTESSALLWGEAGQRILAELTIGIAGLGGVGGMLAEHVARLGIGSLVIVDYDRLEDGNFNRSQGATRAESKSQSPKVGVYSRIAAEAATAPNFHVAKYRESVAETDGLRPLLDCDLILAAADDAFARQVLDHAAYAHLIPIVDGGTALVANPLTLQLQAGKSQIVSAGPGHACLECQGVYTQEEATVARESASWGRYLDLGQAQNSADQRETRAPSVICNNALVAGLMGLRLLALTLRLTPATMRGTQRYYVEDGSLRWGAVRECKDGCTKTSWLGSGDSHFVPVGVDLRWRELCAKEHDTKDTH